MSDPKASDRKEKLLRLRKYPNRRYYDTSRSRYVTLEEIYALIQSGREIQVSDSKTGEDITAKVLAQIILDLDPPKLCVFSVPLLHRLIRSNEELVTDFVDRYFNQAMTAFLDSQKTFEQSIRQTMGLPRPASLVPEWMQMVWNPMTRGLWPPAPYPAPPAAPAAAPAAPPDEAAGPSAKPAQAPESPSDVHAMRGEIEELKQLIQGLREQLSDAKAAHPIPVKPAPASPAPASPAPASPAPASPAPASPAPASPAGSKPPRGRAASPRRKPSAS